MPVHSADKIKGSFEGPVPCTQLIKLRVRLRGMRMRYFHCHPHKGMVGNKDLGI